MNGLLMLAGSFPPRLCGVADYTERLAHHLALQGAPVSVWTREGETAPAPGIYPVITGWDSAGVRDLVRQIREARPTVVHLQYERALFDQSAAVTLLLPELLRGLGIPLVTTFHALDGPARWGRGHRVALLPLLLQSRSIVVCSLRQERALARLSGIARKVSRIPIGTGIEPVNRPAAAGESRPQSPARRLIYFGFVWRGRGIETLLRTVAALPETVTLEVIGGIRDSVYLSDLLDLARDLSIKERIAFSGDLAAEEVSRRLWEADSALLPFPTGVSTGRSSLMAALAHGLPIVTTHDPANLSSEFRDGENMLLAPVGDEASFLKATRHVVEDAPLRERLSHGALHLARTSFAWPEIARQILALPGYRGLL